MVAGRRPRRVALAVNPTSGRGRGASYAVPTAARLRALGVDVVDVTGADGAQTATRLHRLLAKDQAEAAAAAAPPPDAVVVVGGDGMVHLAVQALAGSGVPLGLVPAGTGNDLARLLGVPVPAGPHDTDAAVAVVAGGHTRPMDAVRAVAGDVTRWWVNVLGAGFDSQVNERANRMRWPAGPRRYDVAMLAELGVFRPRAFRLTLDGVDHDIEAMLVAVGNGRSYGAGMRVCPDAVIDDGLLDVTVIGRIGTPTLLRVFPTVYRGTHVRHPAVRQHRARVVTLDSPGLTAYADGERLAPLPLTSECVAGAVQVLVPERSA